MKYVLKSIITIGIAMLVFAFLYYNREHPEKHITKRNVYLPPDDLLQKIKAHPEFANSPKVLKDNIDALFDTAKYLFKNCSKLKPIKGCYLHAETSFAEYGDKSRALTIEISPELQSDKRFLQMYSQCNWPDPGRFSLTKSPKNIEFPGSSYFCSYIPFNNKVTMANTCGDLTGYDVSFETPQFYIMKGNSDYKSCDDKLLNIEMFFNQYPDYQMTMSVYLINE